MVLIRDLVPDDSIAEITKLLHAAYGQLARAGFRYLASHQDEATTLRRLMSGTPLIAERGGSIVGTATLYGTNVSSPCEHYRRQGVFHFGQFAVWPELQRGGIGLQLMSRIGDRALDMGAMELALDTAEGATHLVQWYERLGFRFVQHVSWDVTNYRSVVMSKPLSRECQAVL